VDKSLIVIPELGDQDGVVFDFEDDSMFGVDPPGPISGQGVSQRFGFSDTFEFVSLNIAYQLVNPFQNLLVGLLPVEIICPGVLREDESHLN